MTPRALLTAIGATALAFAVAIGVAADSTTELAAGSAPVVASATATDDGANVRLAAWNDPCVIAV